MNPEKFTTKTQEALQEANNIAESKGQQLIENGHLLKKKSPSQYVLYYFVNIED